jgi:hypothetical protein
MPLIDTGNITLILNTLKHEDFVEWTDIRHKTSKSTGRDPVKVFFNMLQYIPLDKIRDTKPEILKHFLYELFTCAPEMLWTCWTLFAEWFNVLVPLEDNPIGWKAKVISIFTGKE